MPLSPQIVQKEKVLMQLGTGLVRGKGPTEPETPKNSKQRKSNEKVTVGVHPKSNQNVTRK